MYGRIANSSGKKGITLNLDLKSVSKVQKLKILVSFRVMDSIHYKESLMLLGTYVADFGLLILQGFYIKQEELIGQKLFFILLVHQ
jgi:hypothetical protein